jgi:hypothetical protein
MLYLCVQWHHNLQSEPVWLYCEVDDGRWEQRKVEVYANGAHDWADQNEGTGKTMLGDQVTPSLEEIAESGEFTPREISRDDFEEVWRKAKSMWPNTSLERTRDR